MSLLLNQSCLKVEHLKTRGSSCGSVGRVVASDTVKNLFLIYLQLTGENTQIKRPQV